MPLNIVGELNQSERNKIYLIKCLPFEIQDVIVWLEKENIPVLNIGNEMALLLKDSQESKYLNIEAYDIFTSMMENHAKQIKHELSKILAIFNLGILLEPELCLDASRIIKDLSKNIHIILIWENQFDIPGKLHWGNQADKYFFDFSDINLNQLHLNHEI